jgi:hypothetical protein
MLMIAPGVAAAEPPSAASSPSVADQGAELLRRGRLARATGRWAEEETAFEEALKPAGAARMTEVQRAIVLGELGLCELAQHKYREAAEHLSESLDHDTALPRASREAFHQGMKEAAARVGRLYVTVTPSDAALRLDGERIGTGATSYLVFVEPGAHTLRGQLGGYEDSVQWFEIDGGMKLSSHLMLSRAPLQAGGAARETRAPPAASKGPARVPQGLPVEPSAMGARLRIAGGVAAGAAAVASGVFFALGAAADAEIDDRNAELDEGQWPTNRCKNPEPPPECAAIRGAFGRKDTWNTVGWVALAGAAAIGGATLTSALVARGSTSQGGVRVAPAVAGDRVGMVLLGAW